MPKPEPLPMEVHDHFRKANVLHGYVQDSLGEATKHALETGQELMAAKQAVPHGVWEDECTRLFDGSLRTAQFYMQFAKDVTVIKSAPTRALLMLEGSLKGAADAARKAAAEAGGKQPPKRSRAAEVIDVEAEPAGEDGRTEPDGTEAQETTTRPPRNGKDKPGGPPKQYDRSAWFRQWEQVIGPPVRLVDKIAEGVGEKCDPHQEAALEHLEAATQEIMKWMGVEE